MREMISSFPYGDAVFRVGVVDSEEERKACYRLRYNSYCLSNHALDHNRFDPKNYPEGLEMSAEDPYSHLFLATKTVDGVSTPVGTFRLIPCDLGFYVENTQFGPETIRLPERHRGELVSPQTTFEAGRWVGHWESTPKGERRVLVSMMLLEAGMRLTQELGRTHWFCVIDEVSAGRLRYEGWILDQLIPGVHTYLTVASEACLMPMLTYGFNCPRLGAPLTR